MKLKRKWREVDQVPTRLATVEEIMCSPTFALGVADVPPPPRPAPRPGPERVRLPSFELPSRPFAALEQLRWKLLREVGRCEQPTPPREWK